MNIKSNFEKHRLDQNEQSHFIRQKCIKLVATPQMIRDFVIYFRQWFSFKGKM